MTESRTEWQIAFACYPLTFHSLQSMKLACEMCSSLVSSSWGRVNSPRCTSKRTSAYVVFFSGRRGDEVMWVASEKQFGTVVPHSL